MTTSNEQATTANTGICRSEPAANGVRAPVVDLGAADYHGARHLGSNVAATPRIVRWFADPYVADTPPSQPTPQPGISRTNASS
ncbi:MULTISPECIES: hypothetical protein [unclassified Streptomyces]|uniref:hypothetical protein n=1 Tax=unclassified Streptomyces TaxID=2593676 RepID=UPI002E2819FE|nr:hypothetical protein [Streptomyces sp. NBC_01423]WSX95105.1 hypothetical protein OH827_33200 [Streptomyces sp. NBC_00891]WSY09585.1 hypothetical protein OG464_33205 [Streptomyces sp. NBC_00890]WSZ11205.1 hypothetical protein OG704_33205 [Streptomyces sp. NBC_00869]WSZ21289.1 hypothetical protein OG498_00360 [Streptomyces sp. NBC_00870]